MKQEIYLCDNCKKILSKEHLSINFGEYSGWVKEVNGWRHFVKVSGIKQFCSGKCLGEYFDKLLKENGK